MTVGSQAYHLRNQKYKICGIVFFFFMNFFSGPIAGESKWLDLDLRLMPKHGLSAVEFLHFQKISIVLTRILKMFLVKAGKS